MPLLSTTYSTKAEMQRLLSSYGVQAFSDHCEIGVEDNAVIADCINQATEETDFHTLSRYDSDSMKNSQLVRRWATTLACYFLCQRCGNPVPESLQREFDRLTARDGEMYLAGTGIKPLPGVAMNGSHAPSFSNLTIDRRHRSNTVRVTPSSSNQTSALPVNEVIQGPTFYE